MMIAWTRTREDRKKGINKRKKKNIIGERTLSRFFLQSHQRKEGKIEQQSFTLSISITLRHPLTSSSHNIIIIIIIISISRKEQKTFYFG